jgi:hypothetical protein
MTDAMFDLLYIMETVIRIATMAVVIVFCYCFTNGFKKRW